MAMKACFEIAGLLVGFLGALFLTISQVPGSVYEGRPGDREERAYIVLRHPCLWKWGLGLLCGAFALQLAALLFARVA
jgi:hypothetical protein